MCDIYLWAETYKRDDIPIRECVSYGYDTPAPPPVIYQAALRVLEGTSQAIAAHLPYSITSGPLCGGALAPEHERPWSDAYPGKVADAHVWPDGEVTLV